MNAKQLVGEKEVVQWLNTNVPKSYFSSEISKLVSSASVEVILVLVRHLQTIYDPSTYSHDKNKTQLLRLADAFLSFHGASNKQLPFFAKVKGLIQICIFFTRRQSLIEDAKLLAANKQAELNDELEALDRMEEEFAANVAECEALSTRINTYAANIQQIDHEVCVQQPIVEKLNDFYNEQENVINIHVEQLNELAQVRDDLLRKKNTLLNNVEALSNVDVQMEYVQSALDNLHYEVGQKRCQLAFGNEIEDAYRMTGEHEEQFLTSKKAIEKLMPKVMNDVDVVHLVKKELCTSEVAIDNVKNKIVTLESEERQQRTNADASLGEVEKISSDLQRNLKEREEAYGSCKNLENLYSEATSRLRRVEVRQEKALLLLEEDSRKIKHEFMNITSEEIDRYEKERRDMQEMLARMQQLNKSRAH